MLTIPARLSRVEKMMPEIFAFHVCCPYLLLQTRIHPYLVLPCMRLLDAFTLAPLVDAYKELRPELRPPGMVQKPTVPHPDANIVASFGSLRNQTPEGPSTQSLGTWVSDNRSYSTGLGKYMTVKDLDP